jgi:hypothetical protein
MDESGDVRAAIGEAAQMLDSFAVDFAETLTRHGPLGKRTYVETTVTSLGALGYLQCRAMVAVVRSGTRFTVQLGQLLRPLVEAWAAAAWITVPTGASIQLQRALGYEKHSLGQVASKLDYQRRHRLGSVDDTVQRAFDDRVRDLNAKADDEGIELYPRMEVLLEGLDRQDRYLLWRWESAPVHAASSALAQLMERDADGVAQIGGRSNPLQVLTRLVTAFEVGEDLFRETLTSLAIDDRDFTELAASTEANFRALMQQVAPGSVVDDPG